MPCDTSEQPFIETGYSNLDQVARNAIIRANGHVTSQPVALAIPVRAWTISAIAEESWWRGRLVRPWGDVC